MGEDKKRTILRARKDAGISQSEIADHLGVHQSTVSKWERNPDSLEIGTLRKISAFIGLDPIDLLSGITDSRSAPIAGEIGRGSGYLQMDGQAVFGHAIAPPSADTARVWAVRVRDDSMYPAFRAGDIVYIDTGHTGPAGHTGRDCVVQTESGDILLRELRPGSQPGKYSLAAHNQPPAQDAVITWAAPVIWVHRGGAKNG